MAGPLIDQTLVAPVLHGVKRFRRELASLGVEFDADMSTVFERFEVVYTEEVGDS